MLAYIVCRVCVADVRRAAHSCGDLVGVLVGVTTYLCTRLVGPGMWRSRLFWVRWRLEGGMWAADRRFVAIDDDVDEAMEMLLVECLCSA